MFKALRIPLLIAPLLTVLPVAAYEAEQVILRVGIASVQPNDDSNNLSLLSNFAAPLNAGSLAGTGASVEGSEALGITATYMLSPSMGIGLLLATPFEHDINANLNGLGLGTVSAGSSKQLPPTLTAQWYPMGAGSDFQPYLGLGLNYTTFFSEEVDPALEAAVGVAAGSLLGAAGSVPLSGKMSLEDSWGLAAEIGFDYALNDKWLFNASLWYLDLNTEATIDFYTATGAKAATVKTDVDINPWVYMVSLGYTF